MSQNDVVIKRDDVHAKHFKVNLIDLSIGTHRYARKRIYHECEVLIYESVPRVIF